MSLDQASSRRASLLAILRVQYPDVLAKRGYRLLHPKTGELYTRDRRHLVATCRSVANFAAGVTADGPDWCVDAAEHGLEFLRQAHRGDSGYHQVVDSSGHPVDRTRSAYGHAFVLLAYARTAAAGVDGAKTDLEATHHLIEDRFRDAAGMLRSDCDPDWSERETYRGQNANMHACEAYLAAYEATSDESYLDRARHLAKTITVDLAAETDGLLWEHYTSDWNHDFSYNEDVPRHQFRPPGYQPGHHLEWAKFLALLDRYDDGRNATSTEWYSRSRELFDAAINHGWTGNGFVYTHDADGMSLVPDQYGWTLAEALGASAALAERADAHDDDEAVATLREWERRFVACTDLYRGPAGVWYEKRYMDDGSEALVAPDPPGVEPDYHPTSAFYESWRSARLASAETDNTLRTHR